MMGKEIKAKKQAEARNFWVTTDANRGDYRGLFGMFDTGKRRSDFSNSAHAGISSRVNAAAL